MERIDLHIHSCYSDGTDTPEMIVKKAKELGLEKIALTDHNILAGIREFMDACRRYDVNGIPGIELTTNRNRKEIHILGYYDKDTDFDAPEYELLRKTISDYAANKTLQNETIVANLAAAGVGDGRVSVESFRAFLHEHHFENANRVHIANYLMSLGLAEDINDAMKKWIGTKAPYYVGKKSITTAEAIHVIRKTGGRAVPAHMGEYRFTPEEAEAFLIEMTAEGASGFELEHPHNDAETMELIRRFAAEHKAADGSELLLTAGSDYHGGNKPNRLGKHTLDTKTI